MEGRSGRTREHCDAYAWFPPLRYRCSGAVELGSAATYLPYPKSMFTPLVFHPSPQHQESNSLCLTFIVTDGRQRQNGSGITAT